jgi:hypothetical protein
MELCETLGTPAAEPDTPRGIARTQRAYLQEVDGTGTGKSLRLPSTAQHGDLALDQQHEDACLSDRHLLLRSLLAAGG